MAGSVEENAPWLFTYDYYLDELQAVADHFHFKKFHLFGQSWGTVIGQLYAIRHPMPDEPLASLTLSGALSDTHLYMKGQADCRIPTLPPFIQQRVHSLTAQKQFDSAEYTAIDDTLSRFFVLRLQPMPDCLAASFANFNPEIYVKMQGPSEFEAGGILGDMNLTGKLGVIRVPTLVSHGLYDTMAQPCVEVIHKAIPDPN